MHEGRNRDVPAKSELPWGDILNYNKLLNKFKLSEAERKQNDSIIKSVLEKVAFIIKDMKLDASPVLVGSSARGTSLKNSDIDIFIQFSKDLDNQQMERYGLEIGFRVIPDGKAKYAEHPYVSGLINNVKVDIVPCYRMKIGERTRSSVDRTPLHTEFLNSVMDEKDREQAIILKLFLKRIGVYGSELKTGGFSGYVSELCIYYHKTFENFLKFINETRNQLVIGPNSSDFNTPVVLIDPVDDRRNAASAVSEKSLSILRISSAMYLKNPDPGFIDLDNDLDKEVKDYDRKTYMIILELKRPDIIDDILFPQIELFKRNLMAFAQRMDFHFMNAHSSVNSSTIQVLLELESGTLPALKIHEGPPADNPNALRFYEKYLHDQEVVRGPFVKNDRIYVEIQRKDTNFKIALEKNISKLNLGHNLNSYKGKIKMYTSKKKILSSMAYREFMSIREPPDLSAGENLKE